MIKLLLLIEMILKAISEEGFSPPTWYLFLYCLWFINDTPMATYCLFELNELWCYTVED